MRLRQQPKRQQPRRSKRRSARWGRTTRGDDRGAAAVEFAIIVPLLAALTFGLIDGSLTFFRWTAISQATRAGAATASTMSTDALADYRTLRSVAEILGGMAPEDLDRVVIYNAEDGRDVSPMDNPPPSACLTNPTGVSGACNVYTAADLGHTVEQHLDARRFASWDPAGRDDAPDSNGIDYVGVYVRASVKTPTKLFGADRAIGEFTVVRIEPRATPYPS